jgi:hypothetical protein
MILFGQPMTMPVEFTGDDARIIIIGHGDRDSTIITNAECAEDYTYTPVQLAQKIKAALGNKRIGRIALKACWAAGNSKPAQGQDKVGIKQSFAWQLASVCGFAGSVTGKMTQLHRMMHTNFNQPTGVMFTFARDEGANKARKMIRGDGVILTPNPDATIELSKDPTPALKPAKNYAGLKDANPKFKEKVALQVDFDLDDL